MTLTVLELARVKAENECLWAIIAIWEKSWELIKPDLKGGKKDGESTE